MKGYSLDLRERVVAAANARQGKTAVSKRFGVSLSTVKRYLKRQAQGELAARHHPGRPQRLDAEGCEVLRRQVAVQPDWSLEQHAAARAKATGIELKKSSVGNYLKRMGITHKKRALQPQNAMKKSELCT